jgi:hypothetical protein
LAGADAAGRDTGFEIAGVSAEDWVEGGGAAEGITEDGKTAARVVVGRGETAFVSAGAGGEAGVGVGVGEGVEAAGGLEVGVEDGVRVGTGEGEFPPVEPPPELEPELAGAFWVVNIPVLLQSLYFSPPTARTFQ